MKPPTGFSSVLKNKSALVVDEFTFARRLLVDVCRQIGVGSIDASKNAEQALYRLSQSDYDVIISDWGSRPLDGPKFVRSVRTAPSLKSQGVPIVLLKVAPCEADVIAARDAGAAKLIARPFSAQALLGAIVACLKL